MKLWLRNEVFHGVLPMHPDLTIARTREVIAALRLVAPNAVEYASWVSESWRILGWNEPHAKLFWEMACLFRDAALPFAQVPITDLAIFLLLHVPHFATSPRINPAPAAAFTEVWPVAMEGDVSGSGESRSPRGSPRGSPSRHGGLGGGGGLARAGSGGEPAPRSPSSARALCLAAAASAESHRLGIVKERIFDILQLVSSDAQAAVGSLRGQGASSGEDRAPPGSRAPTGGGDGGGGGGGGAAAAAASANLVPALHLGSKKSFTMTAADVDHLGFLLAGGHDLSTPVEKLSSLAPCFGGGAGVATDDTRSAAAGEVAEWLVDALTVNEVLYPPPPSPTALEDHRAVHSDAPTATEVYGAEAPVHAAKPRVVNLVSRQTISVANEAEGGDGEQVLRDLHVNHCSDAHIYLLEPYRCATIFGCTDCTIVVGAVRGNFCR